MEESISGFKHRGSWGDIVEHGERITSALRDAGVDSEAFEEWDEWRPKSHERLSQDVNEKTAEQASVGEGEGEKAGKKPEEDLQSAGRKLSESYEKVEEGDNEGAVERWQDSIDYVKRAADSASRKALRTVENTVYRKVMTQLAPYYFDNELVSANVQRVTRGAGDEVEFVFEVNVNDDDLKEAVSARLTEYEDEVDRWHIDTEKDTTTAEAAEGVEAPRNDPESKSTTN
ncbi:hypothetical protein C2R22_20325 [Salinigranum rubrum]|uniref:Uncharacterized protein n=1 Tax=Salinigranum rubrum TaxID=755307 RepID=A0A2I8VP55_9EURY|nr:DUF5828 family protein [Salinigranum rubrum]AUV83703.1 hypothetical protein C2R22_20325 [Salinigranum rubrum]